MSNAYYKQNLLDTTDVEILKYLFKKADTTPSTISLAINKPRTTVSYRLKKLESRGFCIHKKAKNLSVWSLTKPGSEIILKRNQTSDEINITNGIENIEESVLNLAKEYHTHRIYMFEPSEQTKFFVEKSNEYKFQETNKLIKKHDLIVEVIIGEKTLSFANRLSSESRKSMFGRATIAYQLPDTILNLDQVIICFMEDTYFIDYNSEKIIHIENKEITQSFRRVFEHYKLSGKRIDFNHEIIQTNN